MNIRPSDVLLVAVGALLIGPRPFQAARHFEFAPPPEERRTPDAGEDRLLVPGQPQRRDIAGGEVHHYRVKLHPEEFVHIVVDQQGISVAMALFAGDGAKLTEMDTPTGMWGAEKLSWIAAVAENYRLEVRSSHEESPPGRYEIQVAELRRAEPPDFVRLQAETIYREGRQFEKDSIPQSFRKAIDRFERCLPLFRKLGDRRNEALILTSLGRAHLYLREGAKAETYLREALPIWREVGDREDEGGVLFRLGALRRSTGRMEEALAFYQEALFPARELGDKSGEAEVLTSMGGVYDSIGEKRKALENYRLALPIMREMRNRTGELRVTANIGAVYEFQGDMQAALEQYRRALEICHAEAYRKAEPVYLANIGRVYVSLGETGRGIEYLERALSHYRELGDRWREANVLVYIGQVYAREGNWSQAIEQYEKAVPLYPPTGDPRGEATGLSALGQAQTALGQAEKAVSLLQTALDLARRASDRYLEADVLTGLGVAYAAIGDREKALEMLNQALPLRRQVEDRPGFSATSLEIARVQRSLGNLEASRRSAETSLDLVESLRAEVANPDLRATYLGTLHQHYAFWIDLLMEMHRREPTGDFDRRALEASERARARTLLDLLAESAGNVARGADADLLERERFLAKRIAATIDRRVSLLQADAGTGSDPADIESLRAQYEDVRARIRAGNPRYAALTQPRPVTVEQLALQLDSGTLLLEYQLGEERSFLWAVTATSLRSFELPARAVIESAARRVYELLTQRNRTIEFETPEERRKRLSEADGEYDRAASELSRLILLPVAGLLSGQRLLVVADGALQYVPFAALPAPRDSSRVGVSAIDHEIVSLPSASMLVLLRQELAGRRPAPRILAVLADPVFDEKDERLKAWAPRGKGGSRSLPSAPREASRSRLSGAAEGDVLNELVRSAGETGLPVEGANQIPRLPFTRREARAILALVPPGARKEALDFEASLATARSPELAGYRFIHFATHGFLNSEHPEHSGLVLSLVDRNGKKRDGFLSVADVFDLNLPAELVVLSGCRTGLGKEIKGEGLVGLTRAFFYAGAARVLVSLWDVNDEATAVLMERFYREMLRGHGSRPAAALRAAQASVRAQKRWQAPYYWAGFVLQGEPTGIVSRASP